MVSCTGHRTIHRIQDTSATLLTVARHRGYASSSHGHGLPGTKVSGGSECPESPPPACLTRVLCSIRGAGDQGGTQELPCLQRRAPGASGQYRSTCGGCAAPCQDTRREAAHAGSRTARSSSRPGQRGRGCRVHPWQVLRVCRAAAVQLPGRHRAAHPQAVWKATGTGTGHRPSKEIGPPRQHGPAHRRVNRIENRTKNGDLACKKSLGTSACQS